MRNPINYVYHVNMNLMKIYSSKYFKCSWNLIICDNFNFFLKVRKYMHLKIKYDVNIGVL